MTKPRVSIVIPNFNYGRYLERAINSVIRQPIDVECMVLDGGSTDESVDIVKRYAPYLSYWHSKRDGGQVVAISEGFRRAEGSILGWLNSDDFLAPNALCRIVEAFERNPKAVAVSGKCILVDANDRPFKAHRPVIRDWRRMIQNGAGLSQMSTFWTRQAYLDVGGLDESLTFSFDFDLFVRLSKYGQIVPIQDYISMFRWHSCAKSSNLQSVAQEDNMKISMRYRGKAISHFWHRLNPTSRVLDGVLWTLDKKRITNIVESATKAAPLGLARV